MKRAGLILLAVLMSCPAAADYTAAKFAFDQGDYKGALAQLRKVAAAKDDSWGYPRATHQLGWMYENGKGVSQDYAEALKYYRMSAAQVYPDAMVKLAKMLDAGKGCPKNVPEAIIWIRKAAETGHVEAMVMLGRWCLEGHGMDVDLAESLKWLRKAIDKGNAEAKRDLGKVYFKMGAQYTQGIGGVPNPFEAFICFKLAAAITPEKELRDMATRYSQEAAGKLSADQLEEAKIKSFDWKPKKK